MIPKTTRALITIATTWAIIITYGLRSALTKLWNLSTYVERQKYPTQLIRILDLRPAGRTKWNSLPWYRKIICCLKLHGWNTDQDYRECKHCGRDEHYFMGKWII